MGQFLLLFIWTPPVNDIDVCMSQGEHGLPQSQSITVTTAAHSLYTLN